jgi:hypothetical protein
MTRRNMQIHGFDHHAGRLADDHHGLVIENLRRRGIAELHLSIDIRADLAADTQVDDGRPGMCRHRLAREMMAKNAADRVFMILLWW